MLALGGCLLGLNLLAPDFFQVVQFRIGNGKLLQLKQSANELAPQSNLRNLNQKFPSPFGADILC